LKLLLDTHVLLWVLTDSPQLSRRARKLLSDPENAFWVSAASAWEIAIKVRLGKLRLDGPFSTLVEAVEQAGLQTLDVTLRHATALELVSAEHGDPFDRLLLAQCEVETLRLLTADRRLRTLPQAFPI
jgi:PIN domain nuclease of toxin-antitoxin system